MRPSWRTAATLCVSALLLFVALPAAAKSLDEAKAAGEVGEQHDGYVGLVNGKGSAAARQLVERVNADRGRLYDDPAPLRAFEAFCERLVAEGAAGS